MTGPIVELIDLNEAIIQAIFASAIDSPLDFDYALDCDEPVSLPVVGSGDQKPLDQ